MSDYKYKLSAVIPTVQYGNIQPEFAGDDLPKLEEQIQEIWSKYSDAPLKVNTAAEAQGKVEIQTCMFSGTEVRWDPAAHRYFDGYMGGSTFKKKFLKPFNVKAITTKMCDGDEKMAEELAEAWAKKGEAHSSLGTAIHAALELYGRFNQTSHKVGKGTQYSMTDSPIMRPIVEEFYADREDEDAIYEPFVANEDKQFCGFIDRLLVVDREKKIVRVQDFKTDVDINKREDVQPPFKGVVDNTKLGAYWIQLSFYGWILEQAGYTVEGLDIFHITVEEVDGCVVPKINTHTSEMLDVQVGFKEVGR